MENNEYIVITPYFPTHSSYMGSYVYDQAKAIKNTQKYNVRIIKVVPFFSKEKDYIFHEFDVKIFKVFDLPFFIFPGFFNWFNSIRFRQFFYNNNLLASLSIIHAHVTYPSVFLANSIALISKVSIIAQHHGIDVLQLLNGRLDFIKRLQNNFIKKKAIQQLNKVALNVYVSKRVRDELSFYNTYKPKSEYVLYNGVDRTKFYKTLIKKDDDIYKIGCVANFWPIKDQISLIKAVDLLLKNGLNDIRLHFIGSGETLDNCKEYVKSNFLEKYIYFKKEVPHDKLNDFYNSLDLFVLPSYYEALGCVLLEAWATETPIIAARNQGVIELIPDNEINNLLFQERDIGSLKEKILGEYNKRRLYAFDDKFDIKNTISEFLKLPFFDD